MATTLLANEFAVVDRQLSPHPAISYPSFESVVARLRFPHPYRAALAICSDLDETPDAETYFELMRFLNTADETSMGRGIGLEIGNSIYFDMPPGHFSYWNTDENNRGKIRELIKSGHIDCLHSYGDLATTRAHAQRALDELDRQDCKLKVWVDHARAPSNFGPDIMCGHGDDPSHPAYHADLTLDYGMRYVWRGRVTSVPAQNCRRKLRAVFDTDHVPASTRTVLKESVKQALAWLGSDKYTMHGRNRLTRSTTLRDGGKTIEFLRCNPHWQGVSGADRGDRIHEVLSPRFLDTLVEQGGACILYTHLGKLGGGRQLSGVVVSAFRRLVDYYRSGKILVTTTRRLLDLCSAKANPDGNDIPPIWRRLEFPNV